jgi:hypothetical protein
MCLAERFEGLHCSRRAVFSATDVADTTRQRIQRLHRSHRPESQHPVILSSQTIVQGTYDRLNPDWVGPGAIAKPISRRRVGTMDSRSRLLCSVPSNARAFQKTAAWLPGWILFEPPTPALIGSGNKSLLWNLWYMNNRRPH